MGMGKEIGRQLRSPTERTVEINRVMLRANEIIRAAVQLREMTASERGCSIRIISILWQKELTVEMHPYASALQRARMAIVAGMFVVLVGMAILAWSLSQGRTDRVSGVVNAYHLNQPVEPRRNKAERIAFYHQRIRPILDQTTQRNLEAVDRAVQSLHNRFAGFHAGIDPFVDDVTGWGTRFGIVRRSMGDMWDRVWHQQTHAERVETYVEDKFVRHVFSEGKLRHAMEKTLAQFKADLNANHNEFQSRVMLTLRDSRVPLDVPPNELDAFLDQVDEQARDIVMRSSSNNVVSGLVALTSGIVTEEAVRIVAQQVLGRILTATAATGATNLTVSGGAMAAGAGGGGAGGSAVGPVGTLVGIGVGVAVGAAVDWWMTEQFRKELTTDCKQFLASVESRITDGGVPGEIEGLVTNKNTGLRDMLAEAVWLRDQSMRGAVLAGMVEVTQ